jgi:hypothetical protein
VIPSPFFWLLMAMNMFATLPLPDAFSVPAGAIHHGENAESCLMRSQHTVPLKCQHAAFQEDASIFEGELDEAECPTLSAYHTVGQFSEDKYKKAALLHPANIAGLEAASNLVLTRHGAHMMEVMEAFFSRKQRMLHSLRDKFGDSVYVPPFFDKYNFVGEQRADDVKTARQSTPYENQSKFVCNNLNVIRLPVKNETGVQARWKLALLPNIVGASDEDVVEQVGIFYQLHSARAQRGAAMSQEDVRNLKAVLPARSRP